MGLTIRAMFICAIFTSATDLAFGWSPEWERCQNVSNVPTDQAIEACTPSLNDRSERPNYAMALRNRCGIKTPKADYDGALADCNQALEMQPQSDIAYERRDT